MHEDYFFIFSEGFAVVHNNYCEYGFINNSGEIVIPLIYEAASGFSEGLACVKKDGKYGYIDKTGKDIVRFIYNNARVFCEGLACVGDDCQWGFINHAGEEVVPLIYDAVCDFKNGYAGVEKNGDRWVIDTNGKQVMSLVAEEYDHDSPESYFLSKRLKRLRKDAVEGFTIV